MIYYILKVKINEIVKQKLARDTNIFYCENLKARIKIMCHLDQRNNYNISNKKQKRVSKRTSGA